VAGNCPTVIRNEKPKGVGCQSHGPLKNAQWGLLAGGTSSDRLLPQALQARPGAFATASLRLNYAARALLMRIVDSPLKVAAGTAKCARRSDSAERAITSPSPHPWRETCGRNHTCAPRPSEHPGLPPDRSDESMRSHAAGSIRAGGPPQGAE